MEKNKQQNTIVFATFESEVAPLGGLAAVMKILPRQMAAGRKGACFIVTPFFREIAKCRPHIHENIQTTGVQVFMDFGGRVEKVEVFRYQDENGFKIFLLDSPSFFNAPCDCGDPPDPKTPCNPYLNPSNPEQLVQDALFFSKAVPEALAGLGYTKNLIFLLQDWETASIALTVKENVNIQSAISLLTLHNPYDKLLKKKEFRQISQRKLSGSTVLSHIIPLLDGPIVTVSENFADELIHDPLHTRVYASHLQRPFKKQSMIGINNGVFGQVDFPQAALDAADQEDVNLILREKNNRRKTLIQALTEYQPDQAWGSLKFENFNGPIFLFFGRDDPRQKGYDVAAAAIANIPKGKAKYVFTPIPGDEGLEGLAFLKRLARNRPGEVKVFPFRMERGYMELQKGASFLVMCSLYEPFGGATEGYVVGTPVVARATGGLVQQVCPYPSACFTDEVRRIASRYHESFDSPSGFLFREPDLKPKDVTGGWQKIVECGYWPDGDRLADRAGTLLFEAMTKQASQALMDAIDVYTHSQVTYATLIHNGFKMLNRFSWEDSVQRYQALVNSISK